VYDLIDEFGRMHTPSIDKNREKTTESEVHIDKTIYE
jgi:hypothetical protein